MANFPNSIDEFNPKINGQVISANHINELYEAIEAIEQKIGIDGSTATSWDYSHPPVGSIMAYCLATEPAGYLECDGSAVSRTTYSRLYATIATMYGNGNGTTTFNLPDLRGYFLRGWDHGASVDPDKASRTDRGDGTTGDYVGTKQADEYESHTHTYYPPNQATSYYGGRIDYLVAHDGKASGSTGGNETRPINIAVMWVIKY